MSPPNETGPRKGTGDGDHGEAVDRIVADPTDSRRPSRRLGSPRPARSRSSEPSGSSAAETSHETDSTSRTALNLDSWCPKGGLHGP